MKKAIVIFLGLIFIFGSCTFDECTSKKLYLTSFDNFVKKVEKKHKEFSEDEWKEIDLKFDKLTGECYEKFETEFSKSEKRRILGFGIKYTLYRVKGEMPLDIDINKKDVDNFFDEIDKLVDKEDDITKVLDKIRNDKDIKKATKDFKSGLKNLEKGLEKFGEELEKVFEDYNKEEK